MKIAKISSSLLYGKLSVEIFISGCKHKCDGCHNPELWDFNYGTELSINNIIKRIKKEWHEQIVLTGGDPLWSKDTTLELVKRLKSDVQLPIMLYTGFTKEEIDADKIMTQICELCDIIITDRYDKRLPATNLRGSNNQRIWMNQ